MHAVIVIAAQQDHRRKSRIETKLKFLSDIRREMAVLESDDTTSYGMVVNTITHVIINNKELVIFTRMWNQVLS